VGHDDARDDLLRVLDPAVERCALPDEPVLASGKVSAAIDARMELSL
jgi:hypothetical protein